MAIKRLISHRPCPSEMFSDNGTNFIGAEKELRNKIKALNLFHINRHGTQWEFHTSLSSTQGRLLGKINDPFLTAQELNLLCPLTLVSVDPELLTPNHILRQGFKISIKDNTCKRQVARITTLLDSFWKRWMSTKSYKTMQVICQSEATNLK